MATVLQAEVMQHSGKHAHSPTFLQHVTGIKFKLSMYLRHFSASRFYMVCLNYFMVLRGFNYLTITISF